MSSIFTLPRIGTTSVSARLRVVLLLVLLIVFEHCAIPSHAAHSRRRVGYVQGDAIQGRRDSYDRSVTTFDPTGRLLQVEYAQQASTLRGGTVAAVLLNNTVYVAVLVGKNGYTNKEKEKSYIDSTGYFSQQKFHRIDRSMWIVGAGLNGDTRTVAQHLRLSAQDFILQRGETWTVSQAAKSLANLQHELTHTPGARPLGVACLIFGIETQSGQKGGRFTTPLMKLFKSSPGGILEDCWYCSAGQSEEKILSCLHDRYGQCLKDGTSDAQIIEKLLDGMCDGLGHKTTSVIDDDLSIFDVWVVRGDSTRPGKTVATCFTGLSLVNESMATMRRHDA